MRVLCRIVTAVAGVASAGLLLAGPAAADTGTTVVIGPVAVPSVPVRVCAAQGPALGLPALNRCLAGPVGTSVALTVDVAAVPPAVAVTPPSVVSIPCPAGTRGVAAQVEPGLGTVAVTGTVTVTQPDGTPLSIPVAPVVTTLGTVTTLYGCAGVTT